MQNDRSLLQSPSFSDDAIDLTLSPTYGTDGDPARRILQFDNGSTRMSSPGDADVQEVKNLQSALVRSRISARVHDVARSPAGRYLGYIPAHRRYAQAVPPDMPPVNEGAAEASDQEFPDLATLSSSSSDSSSDIPVIERFGSSTNPDRSPRSAPSTAATPTHSFPSSPAPPITDPLHASYSYPCSSPPTPTPATRDDTERLNLTPSFPDSPAPSIVPTPNPNPNPNPASNPSGHNYAHDYEAVMIAVHDINRLTKFVMGRVGPVLPDPTGGITTPDDVLDALDILKFTLDQMYKNVKNIRDA